MADWKTRMPRSRLPPGKTHLVVSLRTMKGRFELSACIPESVAEQIWKLANSAQVESESASKAEPKAGKP